MNCPRCNQELTRLPVGDQIANWVCKNPWCQEMYTDGFLKARGLLKEVLA